MSINISLAGAKKEARMIGDAKNKGFTTMYFTATEAGHPQAIPQCDKCKSLITQGHKSECVWSKDTK